MKPVRQPIKSFVAFDVENDPVTGEFRCAHLYGEYNKVRRIRVNKGVDKRKREYSLVVVDEHFIDQSKFIEYLSLFRKRKGQYTSQAILSGFNVTYDQLFMLEVINPSTVLRRGSQFISGETKDGVRIVDLARHVPHTSLADWMDALDLQRFGIVKTEHPDLMNDYDLAVHNRMDTMATWHLASFLAEFYTEQGIAFKNTLPAAALAIFSTRYLSQNFYVPKDRCCHEFSRQAYYGGRCEVFQRGDRNVVSYDVNSQYPSVMAKYEYPNPSSASLEPTGDRFFDFYNNSCYLTIACCTVFVPKMKIAPLPYWLRERLIFPTGEFQGVWVEPELKMAEKYGVKIKKVHWYIRYSQKDFYLRDYALDMVRRREQYPKGSPLSRMYKLLGNALYGKFGERHPKFDFTGSVFDCPFDISSDDVRLIPLADGGIHAYSRIKEDSGHTFPELGAFITAYARMVLYEEMKKYENEMVYCDTDCVKYLVPDVRDEGSLELGEFKFEYEALQKFIAPKFYISLEDIGKVPMTFKGDFGAIVPYNANIRGVQMPDDSYTKIKGVGRSDLFLGLDTDNNIIYAEFNAPLTLLQVKRGGGNYGQWKRRPKILKGEDVKRVWNKDGTSMPVNMIIL